MQSGVWLGAWHELTALDCRLSQESSAASGKCHSRARHFGGVCTFPYKSAHHDISMTSRQPSRCCMPWLCFSSCAAARNTLHIDGALLAFASMAFEARHSHGQHNAAGTSESQVTHSFGEQIQLNRGMLGGPGQNFLRLRRAVSFLRSQVNLLHLMGARPHDRAV